jgi:hypothetical protein
MRGVFQLGCAVDKLFFYEDELAMIHLSCLKICRLTFLVFLFSNITFGQDDVPMFSPAPRGAIDWLQIRPNFYDTKLTDEQKTLLAPLQEDLLAHESFLKQKNTGIFRLHPKGKYEITGRTVSVNDASKLRLPIIGGGAYYSFTEKTNKFGPWSDLYLDKHRLNTFGTSRAIGILTELGDVPLAAVSLTTPGLNFLANLNAPQTYGDLKELVEKTSHGFMVGDFSYRSVSDVRPNTTYVLRSILYKKNGIVVFPYEPYHRLHPATIAYDGSDSLIVFRVIRRHQDDSVTILWKRLQTFKTPKIKDSFQAYAQDRVRQLLSEHLVKGMSPAQVIAFLDANNIEHTEYVEAIEKNQTAPEVKGQVLATIPNIERKMRTVFDLEIRLSFNEKQELMTWVVEKNRR